MTIRANQPTRTASAHAAMLLAILLSCRGAKSPVEQHTAVAIPPLPSTTSTEVFVQLAAGARFDCALSSKQRVFCWGDNENGELGEDLPSVLASPTLVGGPDPVTSIAVSSHLCMLRGDGTVLCSYASDASAGLQEITKVPNARTVATIQDAVCVLDADQNLSCGSPRGFPFMPPLHGIKRAFLGGTSLCVTNMAGTGCWAYDALVPSTSQPPRFTIFLEGAEAAVTTLDHGCGRKDLGPWTCKGTGPELQRLASTLESKPATATPYILHDHACFVDSASRARCETTGYVDWGSKPVDFGDWKVESISFGNQHACALGRDGTVRCWGKTEGGRLGDGRPSSFSEPSPVDGFGPADAVIANHSDTCARTTDGAVWCWGSQGSSTPERVDTPGPVRSIGSLWPFCVQLDSKAWTCRRNGYRDGPWMKPSFEREKAPLSSMWSRPHSGLGALGTSGKTFVWAPPLDHRGYVASPIDFVTQWRGHVKSTSRDGICVIADDGSVDCVCGSGWSGMGCPPQVSVLTVESLGGDNVEVVHLPNQDVCAHRASGELRCWRRALLPERAREQGVLPSMDEGVLRDLGGVEEVVVSPNETASVDIGVDGVRERFAGGFVCARTTAGKVACWGDSGRGQTGTMRRTPIDHPIVISSIPKVRALSLGKSHACAVGGDSRVYCWGDDGSGELGRRRPLEVDVPTEARLAPRSDNSATHVGR